MVYRGGEFPVGDWGCENVAAISFITKLASQNHEILNLSLSHTSNFNFIMHLGYCVQKIPNMMSLLYLKSTSDGIFRDAYKSSRYARYACCIISLILGWNGCLQELWLCQAVFRLGPSRTSKIQLANPVPQSISFRSYSAHSWQNSTKCLITD